MTLQEQAIEYKELSELVKKALVDSYSAGAVVGYTTNGTKIIYTTEEKLRKSLSFYRQMQAQAEAQISQLRFIGTNI